jgi:hypothetical protein
MRSLKASAVFAGNFLEPPRPDESLILEFVSPCNQKKELFRGKIWALFGKGAAAAFQAEINSRKPTCAS